MNGTVRNKGVNAIHPSSVQGVGMDGWVLELVNRGVDEPHARKLVAEHSASRIEQAVAYFDSLAVGAGPGLLVLAIRQGRQPAPKRSRLADQAAYCDQIVAWLRRHFPELCDDHRSPHPAAAVAVIHLHYRFGKGRITKREHGSEIRAAVRRWDARWNEAGSNEGEV